LADVESDAGSTAAVLRASEVHVEGSRGPLPVTGLLELRLDERAMTFQGGDPPVAWQVPASAMEGASVRRRTEAIELAGWLAGGYSLITIPVSAISGGAPDDVIERFESYGASRAPQRRDRSKRGWVLAGIAAAGIAAVVVIVVLQSSSTSAPPHATAAQRQETSAKNLTVKDLPSGWAEDDPATAPLGSLLSTSSGGSETKAQKRSQDEVISEYQACMGLTNAGDRVFGAAGVQPLFQVGGLPIGDLSSTSLLQPTRLVEAGSVTQLYASDADVADDLRQITSPRFPGCFAEATGRLLEISASAAPSASYPTSVQVLPRSLGVYTAGANVELPIQGSSSPIEIGVSVLIAAPYEQTLYTYASSGAFDPSLRAQLVSTLAGRLVSGSSAGAA
jgi:hypothetical protein